MTKAELIEAIYKKKGLPNNLTKKAVTEIVESVFDEITDYFVKQRVTKNNTPKFTYPGFGTFTKKKRGARKGRNPQTGEPIKIPASQGVSFAPGTQFKSRLNKKK
jgi:nucleoid DNA-binding protein